MYSGNTQEIISEIFNYLDNPDDKIYPDGSLKVSGQPSEVDIS